jgi:membrane associated rhomboid family serine protease
MLFSWKRITARPITYVLIGVSVIWTLVLLAAENDDWRAFGISDGFRVFGGDYWSLFTSVFVHVDVIHLFFNVYWLAILGGYTEEHFGKSFYLLFIVVCSFCSSALELSVSGETGVGMSGVVYGIFGFLWGAKLFGKQQHEVVDPKTIQVFMVWLFVCILLSETELLAVGNVAHFTGLAVGLIVAAASYERFVIARYLLATLIIVCGVALFFSPWCDSWLAWKAFQAHSEARYRAAESYYTRYLKLHPDDPWALENRRSVRDELAPGSEAVKNKDPANALDSNAP